VTGSPSAVELSIVMPVYNEEAVLEGVLGGFMKEILDRFDSAEMVIVDDASTDETPRILERLAAASPALQVRRAAVNKGHGAALLEAIRHASGRWIFQVDSDGQFLPSDFWKLWDARESADLLIGCRETRNDPTARVLLAHSTRGIVSKLAGTKLLDPNVPFKLFRSEVWDDVQPLIGESPFAPSLMLAVAASKRGWRVHQIPVTHLAREHGPSSLLGARLIRGVLRSARETVALSRRIDRAPRARP
jgi:dolichol-phosphate mannosyltransferase